MSHMPDQDETQDADRSFRERIAQGTEDLSEEARARVIAARERAIAAGRTLNEQAHAVQNRGADLLERQPLIVGAIAFAIGAAIGAALPRTRAEDSAFGATRDDLVAEAERIFQEEKSRAKAALSQAKAEAETAVKDAAQAAKSELAGHAPSKDDLKKRASEEIDHISDEVARH